MKVVRLPVAGNKNEECWVVVHGLSLNEGQKRKLRPIHVLTLLAQLINREESIDLFSLSLALENKLKAVTYNHEQLRMVSSSIGDIFYPEPYIREYGETQRFIASLEAYLSSIYSSLAITGKINRKLHPELNLKMSFRQQAKKFDKFDFSKWTWLPHFYDVRDELVHHSTSLPIAWQEKLIIEFKSKRDFNFFSKGSFEIPIDNIFTYGIDLFRMLDEWSSEELKRVDPDSELDSYDMDGLTKPLKHRKIKAKYFLDLLEF